MSGKGRVSTVKKPKEDMPATAITLLNVGKISELRFMDAAKRVYMLEEIATQRGLFLLRQVEG